MTETRNPSAHLLSLPRELRDRIYTYLTHQLDLTWDRSKLLNPNGDPRLLEPVPIRLPACPLPHVLLIHPQITAEYHEAALPNLTALLDPSLHTTPAHRFRPYPDSPTRSAAVLHHVRHLTLFLQLHARTTAQNLDWADQLALLGELTAHAPLLRTLRVALRQQYHLAAPTVPDALLESVLVPAAARSAAAQEFLPEMPRVLGGMPLVQRGEGFHVGHGGYPRGAAGCSKVLRHGIRKVGVYMYAREPGRCAKWLWSVGEVVARWPMRQYGEDVREIVGGERAGWLMGLPFEMTEWVEERGVQEVTS